MNKKPLLKTLTLTNQGFTLIEVLLASFIFAITIAAITIVFTSSSNTQTQNQVIRETNQSVQYAIEAISRDVKAAKSTYYSVSDVQELCKNTANPTQCENDNLGKIKQKGFEILDAGNQLRVLTNEGEKVYSQTDDALVVTITKDGIIKTSLLTNLNEVVVKDLTFKGVTPANGLTQQPYVTINVSVESLQNENGRTSEKATQELETTITSNYYPYAFGQ